MLLSKEKRSKIQFFLKGKYLILISFVIGLLLYTTIPKTDTAEEAEKIEKAKFCNTGESCIFDIGHNIGNDTDFYLRNGDINTRVLAIDANPSLIKVSRKERELYIKNGQLVILNFGLTRHQESTNMTFWLNLHSNEFSSFVKRKGCKTSGNADSIAVWNQVTEEELKSRCVPITVPTTTCKKLVQRFGTPHYAKIDIEGLDLACLESMLELDISMRPRYVSLEYQTEEIVRKLFYTGYTKFKLVDQKAIEGKTRAFSLSGPWGEEAVDACIGKRWSTMEEIFNCKPDIQTWYDVHAKRDL